MVLQLFQKAKKQKKTHLNKFQYFTSFFVNYHLQDIFFNDMIKIGNIDLNKIKIKEKTYKMFLFIILNS